MSEIRVDSIAASSGDDPVILAQGATLPVGYALTSPGFPLTGVCTAGAFSGDGNALTDLPGDSAAKTIALGLIT